MSALACSAGVLSLSAQFARESATSRSEEEMGRVRKSYYFYSPQSSSVIKSKMAATTTLRTRTRFHPPKIRLHCRLWALRPLDRVNTVSWEMKFERLVSKVSVNFLNYLRWLTFLNLNHWISFEILPRKIHRAYVWWTPQKWTRRRAGLNQDSR